jgi:acetyl esterase/lipase
MLLSLDDAPHSFRYVPAIRYGTATGGREDVPLYLDILAPDPRPVRPVPAVVYLHGGGWESGDRRTALQPWINPLLAGNGFVAVSVSYRLTDEAPFPAQIHDVKAAVRWLRANAARYSVDPTRIGIWGDSAGGHLAALLALTDGVSELDGDGGSPGISSAVQAVVSRCTPTDFTDSPWLEDNRVLQKLFGGPLADRVELRRLASPICHARAEAPPFLLVHGTADEVVPYRQATGLAEALGAHGSDVSLHTVPGGHHNLRQDADEPWSDVPWTDLGRQALDFFTRHLSARRSTS